MPYPTDLSYGPESRVVLVGTTLCVNDSENLPPLLNVERNIHHLARLFTDPDIVGLPPDSVVSILDEAEASAIVTAIAAAAEQATDTLIVYYAGHGLYGDSITPLYLAAKNTTSARKSFNAIRINDVKQAMRTSRARKRVLILDCCYSGRAFQEGSMGSAEDAVRPGIDLEGTYGIAAVPADSKAMAPPDQRLTRFTQSLVGVLEHGIEKAGPSLTLGDIFNAVKEDIGRTADMALPEAINWNQGASFKIARNRFLKQRDLDHVIRGLEGLRETVILTGARIEGIETRLASLEQHARTQDSVEAKRSGLSMVLGIFRDVPIWEKVGLLEQEWDRLPVYPWKKFIRNYYAAQANSGYIFLGACLLWFLSILASLISTQSNSLSEYDQNIEISLTFSVINSAMVAMLWRAIRGKQGQHELAAIATEVKQVFPDVDRNEGLFRIFDTSRLFLFGAPINARSTKVTAVLGTLVLLTCLFIDWPALNAVAFEPLFRVLSEVASHQAIFH
jgi:Caspase domain